MTQFRRQATKFQKIGSEVVGFDGKNGKGKPSGANKKASSYSSFTCTFPRLIWDTVDNNGYTVFHVAVAYRQYGVFSLISQVRTMIHLRVMSQDQDGNNILHLAENLAPRARVTNPQSVILMQREMSWFKVMARLARCCQEIKNNEGLTPRELFSKEHKSLFEYSEMCLKNTAYSFMLVATIFLTVVFALPFSVPGGYDSQTGMPILGKEKSFQSIILYQVFALICSVTGIVFFRSIVASTSAEDDFQSKLLLRLFMGFAALYASLTAAVVGFIGSIILVNPKTTAIMWIFSGILYSVGLFWMAAESRAMQINWAGPSFSRKTDRLTLFTRVSGMQENIMKQIE